MSARSARPSILTLAVKDRATLYNIWMPFIKNGGIFVATPNRYSLGDEVFVMMSLPGSTERLPVAGKVIWISPPGATGNRPAGIGVQLADSGEGAAVRNKIEVQLTGIPDPDKPTQTM